MDSGHFPNCCGAMDNKHIRIVPPAHSGSTFFNFKGTYSVVMHAIIDHNYEIIYIDVGTEGKNADGGIWRQCSFKEYVDDGDLDLPHQKKLQLCIICCDGNVERTTFPQDQATKKISIMESFQAVARTRSTPCNSSSPWTEPEHSGHKNPTRFERPKIDLKLYLLPSRH